MNARTLPLHAATQIDALGETLDFLRMSGIFYCRTEFSIPWGVVLPPTTGCARFHVVVAGQAILKGHGIEPLMLSPGDLVLIPHGDGHTLADSLSSPTAQLEDIQGEYLTERCAVFRHGGGGAAAQIICVKVRFDHPAAHRLIALLPKVIHVSAAQSRDAEGFASTLRLIAAEAAQLRAGGETIMIRLADILVIQAIRWWVEHAPSAQTGWIGAMRDHRIGQAIALIHREPARAWTLASLAAEVAMSRTAFAARFTELVGESAMRYVARWRMYTAVTSLQQESVDVGRLADRLGYQSEAAFNRAFKRVIGKPPGAVRRAAVVPSNH